MENSKKTRETLAQLQMASLELAHGWGQLEAQELAPDAGDLGHAMEALLEIQRSAVLLLVSLTQETQSEIDRLLDAAAGAERS